MRASIVLLVCGELAALAGIGCWSIPAALIVAGVQCVGVGLLREARPDETKTGRKGRDEMSRHRRTSARALRGVKRPMLSLVRKAAS